MKTTLYNNSNHNLSISKKIKFYNIGCSTNSYQAKISRQAIQDKINHVKTIKYDGFYQFFIKTVTILQKYN